MAPTVIPTGDPMVAARREHDDQDRLVRSLRGRLSTTQVELRRARAGGVSAGDVEATVRLLEGRITEAERRLGLLRAQLGR